ncbi:hypothetical protein CPB86DRAFT_795399 [Serendipita vermifera]|nr:hypothetical protein CPB86DRAFT_795399 [Serendipita vermifera]
MRVTRYLPVGYEASRFWRVRVDGKLVSMRRRNASRNDMIASSRDVELVQKRTYQPTLLFVQDMSSYDRSVSAGSRRDGALRDAHSPVYQTRTTSSPKRPIKSLSCRIDNKCKSKWWLVATSELGGLAQGCGREKIRSIKWSGVLGVDEVYDTFWVYTHSNTS